MRSKYQVYLQGMTRASHKNKLRDACKLRRSPRRATEAWLSRNQSKDTFDNRVDDYISHLVLVQQLLKVASLGAGHGLISRGSLVGAVNVVGAVASKDNPRCGRAVDGVQISFDEFVLLAVKLEVLLRGDDNHVEDAKVEATLFWERKRRERSGVSFYFAKTPSDPSKRGMTVPTIHLYHGLSKPVVGMGKRVSYATPHSPPLSVSPIVPKMTGTSRKSGRIDPLNDVKKDCRSVK